MRAPDTSDPQLLYGEIPFRSRRHIRWLLHQIQEGLCGECREPLGSTRYKPYERRITIDHKVPRVVGGTNWVTNLELVHKHCNRKRMSDFVERHPWLAEICGLHWWRSNPRKVQKRHRRHWRQRRRLVKALVTLLVTRGVGCRPYRPGYRRSPLIRT